MKSILFFLAVVISSASYAEDVSSVRQMSYGLAADIAKSAVEACFEQGYQASAVVVDRAANILVVMRHQNASRFTVELATRKANAVILSGTSTGNFKKNRADIREEMNMLNDIIVLEGGLPIEAAGSLLGGIGVSGAPGGDKDAVCAQQGIAAVQERLDFAE